MALLDRFRNRGYKNRLQNPKDALWDFRLGVDTFGYFPAVGDPNTDGHWRVHYVPTPYDDLFRLLRLVDLRPDDVFVDLGSGLGRAPFVASYMGVRRVTGVEIVPELCAKAIENHQRSRLADRSIDFVSVDANLFVPQGLTALFMAHPFGPETLRNVIRNIAAAREGEGAGRLRIVYLNPIYDFVLDQEPWLRCIARTEPSKKGFSTASRHPASIWTD